MDRKRRKDSRKIQDPGRYFQVSPRSKPTTPTRAPRFSIVPFGLDPDVDIVGERDTLVDSKDRISDIPPTSRASPDAIRPPDTIPAPAPVEMEFKDEIRKRALAIIQNDAKFRIRIAEIFKDGNEYETCFLASFDIAERVEGRSEEITLGKTLEEIVWQEIDSYIYQITHPIIHSGKK